MGDTAVALAVQRLLARHNGATSPDALADAASWAARAHHARAALSQLASDGSPLIPATMREALAADTTTELDDLVARVTAWLTQSHRLADPVALGARQVPHCARRSVGNRIGHRHLAGNGREREATGE